MTLEILPVNQKNWREVCRLMVSDQQTNFIESNAQSLLEAAYDQSYHWEPLALYQKKSLVGFAMIGGYDEQKHTLWLDRIMVDEHYQGKGLGSQFILLLLELIQNKYPKSTIYLSVHEQNKKIIPYYQRFGFVDTMRYDPENGERIMYYQES